jgi:DNA-binding transcriptional MerR regulator
MRISDVLSALKTEFPAITHSKLRFLEEQGFIHPVRTNSGYRQYCAADLERLRYVKEQPRERT